jgi:hypothetical protein
MKLSPLIAICFAITASVAAHGQVVAPSVGYVRYANGDVRPIYGLPGNYIVGDSVLTSADAVGFSDAGGVLSTGGTLVLMDSKLARVATADVHESSVLLRIDRSIETAVAWLPESQVVLHWNGKSLSAVSVSSIVGGDTVTSVRKLDPNTASFVVSKPDRTMALYRLSLLTGELKSSIPLAATCKSTWDDGTRIFCFNDRKLSVLSAAGDTLQELALPVEGNLAVEEASPRCLHLSAKAQSQDWLLHLDDKDLQFYQLPGPKTTPAPTDGANTNSAK